VQYLNTIRVRIAKPTPVKNTLLIPPIPKTIPISSGPRVCPKPKNMPFTDRIVARYSLGAKFAKSV
jgi:hypothetical protein